MSARYPWAPLRESLGDDALDAALDDGEHVTGGEDIGFRDSVWPEVAAIYDRLQADVTVSGVMDRLRDRGVDEHAIEIIYRRAALVQRDWRCEDNEPWNATLRRRKRVRNTLARCAMLIENDIEMGGFWLEVGTMGFAQPPITSIDCEGGSAAPGRAMAFSELLKLAAKFADPGDADAEAEHRPRQAVALKTYVLRAMFDELEFHLGEGKRAPNREAEIIAAAILQIPIKPGTLTQLRKLERRPYHRERPIRRSKQ